MRRVLIFLFAFLFLSGAAYAGLWDTIRNATNSIQSTTDTIRNIKGSNSTNNASGNSAAGGGGNIINAGSIWDSYDFIPGDKVLFYDDFSNTDVGEFPRKWTLKGPGGGGNSLEVVEYNGHRWLRAVPPESSDQGTGDAVVYIRYKSPDNRFPDKFTVEFDAVLGMPAGGGFNGYGAIISGGESPGDQGGYGEIWINGDYAESKSTNTKIGIDDDSIHHIAISVNGTFVKAYVDNRRVVNDPDALAGPVRYVGIYMGTENHFSKDLMFTNFKVAEGGKDIQSALDTDGKIVTHGILFDTGSDRIEPQSLPTLKKILAVLQNNPGLKFSVEGHADNKGGAGVNQPLSEKRAGAVCAWLESKGISPDRLQAKGRGDTEPIASNNTAEGRADNRRVEFIKIQ